MNILYDIIYEYTLVKIPKTMENQFYNERWKKIWNFMDQYIEKNLNSTSNWFLCLLFISVAVLLFGPIEKITEVWFKTKTTTMSIIEQFLNYRNLSISFY